MIYFLDFDGCLHRFFPLQGEDDESNALFAFVPQFEEAVRACHQIAPPAQIVISSSWRLNHSLEQIKQQFSPDIQQLIIGGTPHIEGGSGDGMRQEEVELWLRQNGREGEHWIGIDDCPTLYKEGACVVACFDEFKERETALLIEATKDPKAFSVKYPVPRPFQNRYAP